MSEEAKWYVAHTYSGYEEKVKTDLEKTVKNRNLQDMILEVKYPTEEVVEIREDGKRKVTSARLYPGYVMVKMFMNDKTWYVVRNTRGVTGIRRPRIQTDTPCRRRSDGHGRWNASPLKLDVAVGENVRITSGPFENFVGTVKALDPENQKVKLAVLMFGKENMLELDYIAVQKNIDF